MKKFIMATQGSVSLLSIFLVMILCVFSIVIYSVSMIYINYQMAHSELERAAIITVDENMFNRNVRDLEFDIPQTALADVEENLLSCGLYEEPGGTWKRASDGILVYELKDLNVTLHDECLDISVLFSMYLSWSIAEQTEVTLPITVRSKVLYIN